jgi:Fur family iron response transcriptional regulator
MKQTATPSFRQRSDPKGEIFPRPRSPHFVSQMKTKLRKVGLRPSQARVSLSALLFGKGDRHVTAEMLFKEAKQAKMSLSRAAIYAILHRFTEVGLVRPGAINASKSYTDTNNSEHDHFYVEHRHALKDISPIDVVVSSVPDGYEIVRIDVVVRLRSKPISRRI